MLGEYNSYKYVNIICKFEKIWTYEYRANSGQNEARVPCG